MTRASLSSFLQLKLTSLVLIAAGCGGDATAAAGDGVRHATPDDKTIAALPRTSVVYADKDGHFNVHDLNTDKSTRIGAARTVYNGNYAAHFGLSPNRKWIAFAGAPDGRDVYWNNFSAPGVYVMSVDGEQTRKIVDAIPAPGLTSCGLGGYCRYGTCNEANNTCSGSSYNYTINITPMAWSYDSTTVWFKINFVGPSFGGFSAIVGINIETGEILDLGELPCLSFSAPIPHPTKNEVWVHYSGVKGNVGCSIDAGLYRYDMSKPGKPVRSLVPGSSAHNAGWDHFRWSPDGARLVFVRPHQNIDLYAFNVATGMYENFFVGGSMGHVDRFGFSPAGDRIVVCYRTKPEDDPSQPLSPLQAFITDLPFSMDRTKYVTPRFGNIHLCNFDW